MIDRERKVDLGKLSEEQLKSLEVQLGDKIKEICSAACDKANKLLNIYGLQAKMHLVITHKESEIEAVKPKLESAILKNLSPNL